LAFRYHLINVPARLDTFGRRLTLRLPERRLRRDDFTKFFDLAPAPPSAVEKP
jgi:hypothetical protein